MHQWHFCINVWQCFANMCKTFTCFAGYRWNTDITPTMTSMTPVPAFRQNTARSRFSTCPTCAATQLHSYQEKTEATQTRWCLVLSSSFLCKFHWLGTNEKDRRMSSNVPFTDFTHNINGSFILVHCAKGGFIDQQVQSWFSWMCVLLPRAATSKKRAAAQWCGIFSFCIWKKLAWNDTQIKITPSTGVHIWMTEGKLPHKQQRI